MRSRDNILTRNATGFGFGAISVLIVLVAYMFDRQSDVLYNAKGMLLHSYEVTHHLQLLNNRLKDSEIGQRGYIVTGNDVYLDAYDEAVGGSMRARGDRPASPAPSVASEMVVLRKLMSDNPFQQAKLDELEKLFNKRLERLNTVIGLRRDKGLEAAAREVQTLQGKELMDQIGGVINSMMQEEARLFSERSHADNETMDQNIWMTYAGIGAVYLGLLISVLMMTFQWRKTRRMEDSNYRQAEELVEANRQISDSRAFLRNLMNTVADPIFVKDSKHRWIEGNTALWELFAKSEEELLGKTDYDFFPKDEADVFWAKDNEVFTSGKTNINIENFTDATGKTHTISTKKACFTGPGGEKILVGVIRDITELQELQTQLKQSDEARLKAIMDHSGRPVYIKDLEGRFLQVNTSLMKLLGKTEKELIGKSDYELFPKEYADQYRVHDLRVIAEARALEFEETASGPGGVRSYASVKFPLYDAHNRIYALCGISTDVTDQREAEKKLRRYMKELEHSNQELDDFAYIASHDLKEPLRGLFNHATFLMEDYQDKLGPDGIKRLSRLAQLVQRMEHLINDLLYFSQLGRTDLAVQEIDPNVMIREIQQLMESFLREKHGKIVIPTPLPRITCDRPRITEVFRNLITNGIKYNDKEERIVEVGFLEKASSPQGEHENVFYVKDNGIGIDPIFFEEIFRIFKRLQSRSEEKEPGTGSGLTFVKKIIERHNGHIWLHSEAGKGSTFFFTLGKRD